MNKKLLLLCLGVSVAFVSCKKDVEPAPIASYSYAVTGQYAPLPVSFTNTSQNSVSWLWNFGDGGTSNEKSPSHTFAAAGQYTITLEATNGAGAKNTTSQNLTVVKKQVPMPIVGFSFSGDLTFAPCNATFTNTTQNAVSYSWDFGDGKTSTAKTPTHLYSTGGTFNVVLTAMNSDGATANLSKQVTVGNAPTKVNVKQLTLLAFPATSTSGAGWDVGSAADPYFLIGDYPQTVTYYTSSYLTDVLVTSLPKVFPENNTLVSVNADYVFAFRDDDGIWGSEPLGGVHFIFNQFMPTNGDAYPSEITVTGSTNGISFKLAIEWKP